MGREIVYCEICGNKILPNEFEDGKAIEVGTRNFCSKCIEKAKETYPDEAKKIADTQVLAIKRAQSAKREAQRPQMRTTGVSTKEKEALRRIPAAPMPSADAEGKKKQIILMASGGGAIVLIIILVVALSGGGGSVSNGKKGGGDSIGQKTSGKDELLKNGWSLYNSGKYEEAAGKFAEALATDSNCAEAYYGRGMSRQKNNNLDGAIEDCGKAIGIDANYKNAYIARADAYVQKGDISSAIFDYTKVIDELDAKNASAYIGRGWALQKQKKPVDAINDYKKALEFATDTDKALIQQYINDANKDVEKQKSVTGEDQRKKAEELADKAWEDYKTNDFDGAIKKFDEAIKLYPTFARAYNFRAWAKRESNDLKGAIDDFAKAIELDKSYKAAYQERGETKIKLGDIDGAIQDFKKCIELDQTNEKEIADVYCKDAEVKFKANDFKSAEILYDRALELSSKLSDNDKAECYNYRGLSKKELQDWGGALIDLKKAIELDSARKQYLENVIKEIESHIKK